MMLHTLVSVVFCLPAVAVSSAWAAASGTGDVVDGTARVVPGAFIVQCSSTADIEPLTKTVIDQGAEVRYTYKSDIFTGLSLQMRNATGAEERLSKMQCVTDVWPVHAVEPPSPPTKTQGEAGANKIRRPLKRQPAADSDKPAEPSWGIIMSQVDKLHAEGYRGAGIKIAVVDSGVNYSHPALGGCFGEGCRVAFGADLFNKSQDKPMDCLGHGTKVASILAGNDSSTGFRGAAPEAIIGAYRIVGCHGEGYEDTMLAGWQQAQKDGAQIIVSATSSTNLHWPHGPVALAISRIVQEGVTCISAAGNAESMGLFYPDIPPASRGVLSVNSLAQSLEGPNKRAVFTVDGERAVEMGLQVRDLPDYWGNDALEIHDMDADYGDKPGDTLPDPSSPEAKPDNCELKPGDTANKDLVGRIALVRAAGVSHGCGSGLRIRNALDRGATHVLYSIDLSTFEPWNLQLKIVGAVSVQDGKAMASALAAGKRATFKLLGPSRNVRPVAAKVSSYGPSWDLDLKPGLAAAGQDVPMAVTEGGYRVDSGSSFAAPLVAGIVALVAEARKTFDPVALTSLLITNGGPQLVDGNGTDLLTAAHQGGGLVRAWHAAHVTTTVQPATLAFNDTEHRPRSQQLRITNNADKEAMYNITNFPALTLHTFTSSSGRRPTRGDPVPGAAAVIKFTPSGFRLGPGQSKTVTVEAQDPVHASLDMKRLPIWSGWVAIRGLISGTDNDTLTVPYLGVAGSLHSTPVLETELRSFDANGGEPVFKMSRSASEEPKPSLPENETSEKPQDESSTGNVRKGPVPIDVRGAIAMWSLVVLADLVPAQICNGTSGNDTTHETNPKTKRPAARVNGMTASTTNTTGKADAKSCVSASVLTDSYGMKSLGQLAGFPLNDTSRAPLVQGRTVNTTYKWAGLMDNGKYAKPGRYKIVVRALSLFGDAGNSSDWQMLETPVFGLDYE